jgi:uncharacterized protein (TIGR02996 family)
LVDLETMFLRQIQAEPDNATHRLVFADWLEEQGDPRADQIRRWEADHADHLTISWSNPDNRTAEVVGNKPLSELRRRIYQDGAYEETMRQVPVGLRRRFLVEAFWVYRDNFLQPGWFGRARPGRPPDVAVISMKPIESRIRGGWSAFESAVNRPIHRWELMGLGHRFARLLTPDGQMLERDETEIRHQVKLLQAANAYWLSWTKFYSAVRDAVPLQGYTRWATPHRNQQMLTAQAYRLFGCYPGPDRFTEARLDQELKKLADWRAANQLTETE